MRSHSAARHGACFLIVFVALAVCSFAAATAVLAAPPPISGLASQTHPDPAKWYSNPYPAFHWQPALGAIGYSWRFDAHAATVPDTVAEIGGFGFAARAGFATGDWPCSLAVGDFNGDGKQDLVTTDYEADTASVLLGDGAGGFAAKTDVATGAYPSSVAVGDFDKDGKQDLAIAYGDFQSVSVLLGNGSGGFGAKTDFATGYNPNSLAVGDFNADGNADLVTADQNADTVSVLLGDGSGGFKAKTDFATGDFTDSIAVGDFNMDGRQDLVAANYYGNTASVLLGKGNGGFAAKTDVAFGDEPVPVVVGDFNGDGRQDLAAVNVSADTASVLLNITPDCVAAFGRRTDGVWYFHVCTVDGVGGRGTAGHLAVRIDTTAPTTRGLAAASVKKGGTAKLKYQVDDARPGSPTAAVTITVKNSRGKTVKTLKLGAKAVNTALTAKFTCKLAKGKYRYSVYATDAAGNRQSKAGGNRLVVK